MVLRRVLPVVAAAAFVLCVVVAVLVLAHSTSPARQPDAPTSLGLASGEGARFTVSVGVGGARGEAREVLRSWDARRARAYARGDVRGLRSLYLPGSRTGAADVAVLRAYADRGLHVEGMTMQVLGFHVVHRGRSRLVVEVTDRLVGAVAVSAGGRTTLPADRAERRRVVMVERAGVWRVDEVR